MLILLITIFLASSELFVARFHHRFFAPKIPQGGKHGKKW